MRLERYVRKAAYLAVALRERRAGINAAMSEFHEFESADFEKIQKESFFKLKKLVRHAYDTTVYYREIIQKAGLTPEEIKSPADMNAIPCLTKNELKAKKGFLISRDFKKSSLEISFTGGTSGTQTSFFRDRKCTTARIGRQLGILESCGYYLGDRCALIWGVHEDLPEEGSTFDLKRKFRTFASGKETLCCTVMDSEKMSRYHSRLVKFKPEVIYGYPNAMTEFANYIQDKRLAPIRAKTIICTAERLTETQREKLQQVFGGEVFNLYCTREHGCVAFECKNHSGLHVDLGSVFVEVILDGKPARFGKTGQLVITDLLNYGMPFIRNVIGDQASWSERPCSCGCNLPLLKKLDGRITDIVYRPDGSIVAGVMLADLFMDVPEIKAFQIVQDSVREIFLLLVVTEKYNKEIETKALHEMRKYMGNEIRISVRIVSEIPRNPSSGKFQEVICRVGKPR